MKKNTPSTDSSLILLFFVERRGAQEPQSRGEQRVLLDGPGAHRPHLFHVRVFILFNQINWFS